MPRSKSATFGCVLSSSILPDCSRPLLFRSRRPDLSHQDARAHPASPTSDARAASPPMMLLSDAGETSRRQRSDPPSTTPPTSAVGAQTGLNPWLSRSTFRPDLFPGLWSAGRAPRSEGRSFRVSRTNFSLGARAKSSESKANGRRCWPLSVDGLVVQLARASPSYSAPPSFVLPAKQDDGRRARDARVGCSSACCSAGPPDRLAAHQPRQGGQA